MLRKADVQDVPRIYFVFCVMFCSTTQFTAEVVAILPGASSVTGGVGVVADVSEWPTRAEVKHLRLLNELELHQRGERKARSMKREHKSFAATRLSDSTFAEGVDM